MRKHQRQAQRSQCCFRQTIPAILGVIQPAQQAFPFGFGAKNGILGFGRAIFDSHSSFFAPKPHGNACYVGQGLFDGELKAILCKTAVHILGLHDIRVTNAKKKDRLFGLDQQVITHPEYTFASLEFIHFVNVFL